MPKFKIVCGELPGALAELPSFHASLCDPPYGIGDHPTPEQVLKYLVGGAELQTGDFMGRKWELPTVGTLAQLRAKLLPGAHALLFSAPRTFDILGTGARLAGFEVRDVSMAPCMMWVQAEGMPKVGMVGAEIGRRDKSEPATAAAKVWSGHSPALAPAWEPVLVLRQPFPGPLVTNAQQTGCGALWIDGTRVPRGGGGGTRDGEASAERRYDDKGGTNFAMKPGPRGGDARGGWPKNFTLAHLPGCRCTGDIREVRANGSISAKIGEVPRSNTVYGEDDRARGEWQPYGAGGKEVVAEWECVEGCPVAAVGLVSRYFHNFDWAREQEEALDGAEPFRYCAKAGDKERDLGLEDFHWEVVGTASNRQYRRVTATEAEALAAAGKKVVHGNVHPAVKPQALLVHYARLLLPPPEYAPRRILVPWAGSGSEVVACLEAGWDEVWAVERDTDYCAMTEARAKNWFARHGLEPQETDQVPVVAAALPPPEPPAQPPAAGLLVAPPEVALHYPPVPGVTCPECGRQVYETLQGLTCGEHGGAVEAPARPPRKVLVCGGRDFEDGQYVADVLGYLTNNNAPISVVVHGDARGADRYADLWARCSGAEPRAYPITDADWRRLGKRAGRVRNQQMLDDERPDLVVAFPGGRGTAHMVEIARAAGVPVFDAAHGYTPAWPLVAPKAELAEVQSAVPTEPTRWGQAVYGVEPYTGVVVHCKKANYDVYVGRGPDPKTGQEGPWGNPFTHLDNAKAPYHVATREESIDRHEKWLLRQPALMARLRELRGQRLGCWCKPQSCHGDTLARLANSPLLDLYVEFSRIQAADDAFRREHEPDLDATIARLERLDLATCHPAVPQALSEFKAMRRAWADDTAAHTPQPTSCARPPCGNSDTCRKAGGCLRGPDDRPKSEGVLRHVPELTAQGWSRPRIAILHNKLVSCGWRLAFAAGGAAYLATDRADEPRPLMNSRSAARGPDLVLYADAIDLLSWFEEGWRGDAELWEYEAWCDGSSGAKGGEPTGIGVVLDIVTYKADWTGRKCGACRGTGADEDNRACSACAGTGDEHGAVEAGRRRLAEIAEHAGPGTNQTAELLAVRRALTLVPELGARLVIRTDSQYAIGCLTDPTWNVKANREVVDAVKADLKHRTAVVLQHVKGHNGDPGNELADQLARRGRLEKGG